MLDLKTRSSNANPAKNVSFGMAWRMSETSLRNFVPIEQIGRTVNVVKKAAPMLDNVTKGAEVAIMPEIKANKTIFNVIAYPETPTTFRGLFSCAKKHLTHAWDAITKNPKLKDYRGEISYENFNSNTLTAEAKRVTDGFKSRFNISG